MAAVATRMTAEEFLSAPENETCELLDGVPRRMDMGAHSAFVGAELDLDLRLFLRENPFGVALPADAGFAIWPDRPGHVRKPDVSYISFDRLGSHELPRGWVTVPPELAVEVVSPNEKAVETLEKVDDLLGAGVDLVWVIYPDSAVTLVYRADGSITRVPGDQPLDAGEVLPGFAIRLSDILARVPSDRPAR